VQVQQMLVLELVQALAVHWVKLSLVLVHKQPNNIVNKKPAKAGFFVA
jgi:hypothetical protein